MLQSPHPTARPQSPRRPLALLFSAFYFLLSTFPLFAQFDTPIQDLLQNAHPATQPAEISAPSTTQPAIPARARPGTLILSNGQSLKGQIWTTLNTPLRVWDDATKNYQDLDFDLIEHFEAVVDEEKMEPEWRWLKEGSDVKVYSGKNYPTLLLHYQFNLPDNNLPVEGPVVAPIFVATGEKNLNLALNTHLTGNTTQTVPDLVYIKSVTFDPTFPKQPAANKTTKLPLLPD